MQGEYQEVGRRFGFVSESGSSSRLRRLSLVEENGVLLRQFAGQERRIKLLPVAQGLFRHRNESKASVAWVQASDGHAYLQGEFGNFKKIDASGKR